MCPPVSLCCGHHYGASEKQVSSTAGCRGKDSKLGGIQGQELLVAGGATRPQTAELQWYRLYEQQKQL